jgi:hypothetical protein
MTTLSGAGVKGRIVTGWLGGMAGLMLFGCAAPTTIVVRPTVRDMRGTAKVSGREAQALVVGPMRLLHVNSDGRKEPRFTHVWQRDGAVDCHNGTPLDWDGQSAVEIGKDELVCVSSDAPARLFWHGRSLGRDVPASPHQASLR